MIGSIGRAAPAPHAAPFHPILAGSAAVSGAANRAYLQALSVGRSRTVTQVAIWPTVTGGNVDVGIYDDNGARLASSGSTAVGSGGAQQTLTLGSAVRLVRGRRYWLAIALDGTTATLAAASTAVGNGLPESGYQKNTSFPLPSSGMLSGGSAANVRAWAAVLS